MKKIKILLFIVMFSNFFNIFKLFSQEKQNNSFSKEIILKENWEFSSEDELKWKKAQVPGSVQSNLIDLKEVEDPYFGTNQEKIQWIEDKNWLFQNCFNLNKEDFNFDKILLNFEGLDTFADVFLNGSKILSSENMFLKHHISVKSLLKEGENKLLIRFFSPIKHLMPNRITSGFEYPVGNDHRQEKVSVYARKAPYHFGWDWGIRIVQMGIFRPVSLEFLSMAKIEDSFIYQKEITPQKAEIEQFIEVFSERNQNAIISTEISFNKQKISKKDKNILLKSGKNKISFDILIENPKLWQPIHWGEQHLYDFTTKIEIEGKIISTKTQKIGLRSIKLVQNNDEKGQSFYFEVNGNPFFAKGSNYIPGEILTTKQDTAYYHKIFDNLLKANMNMIRVWGGGIYENDYFYQLADQKGILVWQDFMFACVPYPSDENFLNNVKKEAIFNVKRLRNYACISLWCGNNEVEESIKYWGFERQVPEQAYQNFKTGYNLIFKDLLPNIVKEFDPEKDYIHSSPLSANWGRPESLSVGDSHYWGVWYGRQNFEIFNTRIPRFMSEFGFQAFPEMKTIRSFAQEKDFDIESEVMKAHQKSSTGNDAIQDYMQRYYKTPKDFEEFVYLGLVMQGEGMKKGMLSHRRNRPYCMGSLYWQLNDSWPVVSWAGVDYYDNWKALHYKTREAFSPIGVDFYHNLEEKTAEFYIFSDLLQDFKNSTYSIQLVSFEGKILKEFSEKINIEKNQTAQVKKLNINDFANNQTQKEVFVLIRVFDENNNILTQDTFFFFWPKDLNLPKAEISKEIISKEKNKIKLKLKSKVLAKNVFIETPYQGAKFSDNFFDLLPNEEKIIEISAENISDKNLKIRSIKN